VSMSVINMAITNTTLTVTFGAAGGP
jgi:hypothetical protein